MKERLIIH